MKFLHTYFLLFCFSAPSLHATASIEPFCGESLFSPSHYSVQDYNPEAVVEAAFKKKIEADYIKDSRVVNQRFFKYNDFILARQTEEHLEIDDVQNVPEMKELCRTFIKDGLIYDAKGRLGDNANTIIAEDIDPVDFNYVISKKGELYIMSANDGCHSYMLKSKPGNPHYGIGKPVASAGKISLRQGKIISFDIDSGHYWPIEDQLIIATHYMAQKAVFAEDAEIGFRDHRRLPKDFAEKYPCVEWTNKIPIGVFLEMSPEPILNQYR